MDAVSREALAQALNGGVPLGPSLVALLKAGQKKRAEQPPADVGQVGRFAVDVGAGFVPGSGIADAMGMMPLASQDGETSRSIGTNLSQGNYGEAALQGLGAFGDLMMVVGPAGIAAGGALKTAANASKASKRAKALAEAVAGVGAPMNKKTTSLGDIWHGSHTGSIKGGREIYVSPSETTADFYAGGKGSSYKVNPKPGVKVNAFDFSAPPQDFTEKLKVAYEKGHLSPDVDNLIDRLGIEEASNNILSSITDIVEDEGWLRDINFANWLSETYAPDIILAPGGGVIYNQEAFDFVKK